MSDGSGQYFFNVKQASRSVSADSQSEYSFHDAYESISSFRTCRSSSRSSTASSKRSNLSRSLSLNPSISEEDGGEDTNSESDSEELASGEGGNENDDANLQDANRQQNIPYDEPLIEADASVENSEDEESGSNTNAGEVVANENAVNEDTAGVETSGEIQNNENETGEDEIHNDAGEEEAINEETTGENAGEEASETIGDAENTNSNSEEHDSGHPSDEDSILSHDGGMGHETRGGGGDANDIEDSDGAGTDVIGSDAEEEKDVDEIDFREDDRSTMTFGRIIALHLKKFSWYNPQNNDSDEPEGPDGSSGEEIVALVEDNVEEGIEVGIGNEMKKKASIEAAWAFFEHFTLLRHKDDNKENEEGEGVRNQQELPSSSTNSFDRTIQSLRNAVLLLKETRSYEVAAPGENNYKTKLYNPFLTPLVQLGDFGFGIGLYFATLRFLTILMILVGLINIPNYRYFTSQEYSEGQENVSWMLKGSAVCTVQEWVPCPTCKEEDFKDTPYRFQSVMGVHESGVASAPLNFALKNRCDGAIMSVGMVNFATTIVVMIGMVFMIWYLKQKEVEFDEDEQTAQDYSVVVRNPPDDARDPKEWIEFFSTIFQDIEIACCTVVVDNDDLSHSLVTRRELLKTLSNSLPDENDLSMENMKQIADKIEAERNYFQKLISRFFGGVPEKYQQLVHLNLKIVEISQKDCNASSVFVTFEKESYQRYVLEKMNVSPRNAANNEINAVLETKYLFRNKHVCLCEEPAEPSTIRWQDLHVTPKEEAIKYITTGFIFSLLVVSYFIVRAVRESRPTYSAFVISIKNSIFPTLAKALSKFEKHVNEERRQLWLYLKIAIFRCVNTVLFVFIITPYTSRIMDGDKNLLYGVYNIFYAEIVTSTLLQILDIGGNIQRHYSAPRAKTQEDMNLSMRGTEVMIAERYSNMTKLVFLALWYCPLYPGVLFMCAIALFVNYYADTFSLTRTWKPAPKLGSRMSKFNRTIIFPVMLILMAFNATRSWGNYTYDSLCPGSTLGITIGNITTYEFEEIDGIISKSTLELSPTSDSFFFCERNSENMTDEQTRLTRIYGTFFASVTAVICFALAVYIASFIRYYYVGGYSPVGVAMTKKFSEVASAIAYIPQVKSDAFPYPFLACSLDDLNELRNGRFLDHWNNPYRAIDYYDITKDVEEVFEGARQADHTEKKPSAYLFSRILPCPPMIDSN